MSEGRVALVTGGSRGLGRQIALRLAEEGFRVCINYLNDEAAALGVVKAAAGSALALRADVSDPGAVGDMVEAISERLGRLDVLINNAGIASDALLVRLSEASWDRVVKTDLGGAFHTVRALAPLMAAGGGGHIVNIISRSGLRGRAGQASYAASKAALVGLTSASALELGGMGIRVNAVAPGYMPTDMGSKAEGAMKWAVEESLIGALSDPAEAASFISWLVGTKGVTGQVFCIDSRTAWW